MSYFNVESKNQSELVKIGLLNLLWLGPLLVFFIGFSKVLLIVLCFAAVWHTWSLKIALKSFAFVSALALAFGSYGLIDPLLANANAISTVYAVFFAVIAIINVLIAFSLTLSIFKK